MSIKIISAFSNLIWYSGFIGKTFEVAEFDAKGNARIINENEIHAYWVAKEDFEII